VLPVPLLSRATVPKPLPQIFDGTSTGAIICLLTFELHPFVFPTKDF
jgi:hypothetical protein